MRPALALDPERVRRERVRAVFAGLRVLPGGEGETASARRETVYSRGPSGMISVAGGKLTTYRRIALDALEHLRGRPRPAPARPPAAPAAGRPGPRQRRLPAGLHPATRDHLLHLYGSLAPEVLAPAADDPSLLEPLRPDGPDLAAQALYALTHEWALTAEDVLRRRTTAWLRGEDTAAEARVAALLANRAAASPRM